MAIRDYCRKSARIDAEMKTPLVSIIIPTYNSSSTIKKVLESIKNQSYKNIEILIYDAGSSDITVKIAKKYKAKVILNKKQHQVFAKHAGTYDAKGKYIVHQDSDEVLKNKDSIKNKVDLMEKNPKVKGCSVSGHITPKGVNGANYFINEFGDPFSYYMYGYSFNSRYFIDQLKKRFQIIKELKTAVIFDFQNGDNLPGLEFSAAGVMLNRDYIIKNFKKLKSNPHLVSQTFYMIIDSGKQVAVMKNDGVLHYSAASWSNYFNKLRARIINNLFQTEMGKSAFSGRGNYYSLSFKIKKYLFVPYSFTFSFIEGIELALTRKNIVFLLYPFICMYISLVTMYVYFARIFGLNITIPRYGF